MLARISAVFLIGLTRIAIAADASGDFPAFPSDPSEATSPSESVATYGVDTPIKTLAANPTASAIVDANIPGLLEDGNYSFFKSMSLKTVTSVSHGQISRNTLETVGAQLKLIR